MGHKKLIRFEAIKHFKNVIEYPNNLTLNWQEHFNNANPIILELACGKGEYTIGIAQLNPSLNLIGIDIKGNRIWNGAKYALENNLKNVCFIRTQIQFINQYFAKNAVNEIWITFPDPHISGKEKNRLTSQNYLSLYKQILKQTGLIHLKTDSPILYEYTIQILAQEKHTILFNTDNLYAAIHLIENKQLQALLQINTYYEKLDIAGTKQIYYIQFKLN